MQKPWKPCSECVKHCFRTHKLHGLPKKGFCFFKVLIGKFDEHLRIPPAFLKHLEHEHSNISMLEGPSGKLWHLTLERTPNSMVLQNGWEKFVKDHSLELGDFLVFQYNGGLHFTVQIFDKTACEKEDLLSVDEYSEDQEEVTEVTVRDIVARRSKSRKAKALKRGGKGKPTTRENVNFNKKRSVIVRNITRNLGGKAITSYIPSKHKDSWECVSKRRAVTEVERARAYEEASSFSSSKPCFTVVMKPSHVYRAFVLSIPSKFARIHCPHQSKFIFLSDPRGRRWRVHRLCGITMANKLSKGWRSFSLMNNLEEGDACVFELVDECNFEVHIFRVVDI